MNRDAVTRREFLGRAGAGAAAIGMAAAGVGAVARGLSGCGCMGSTDMEKLMENPVVQIAALCDVDTAHIPTDFKKVEQKYGKKPEVYGDYRKLLERKDIDAVIIGTPDHR